jgi:hypothetical protein
METNRVLIKKNSSKQKADILKDIESRTPSTKNLPENIYVKRKGQLVKIDEVKIIWSSYRQEYKLIPSNFEY